MFGHIFENSSPLYIINKIGHSSRSSSIQRSKITVTEVSGNHNFWKLAFLFLLKKRWTKDKQTDKKKKNRQKEEKKNRQKGKHIK